MDPGFHLDVYKFHFTIFMLFFIVDFSDVWATQTEV